MGRRSRQSPPMTPDLLLAIDVGTQSVRALAFDRTGGLQGRAQVLFEPPFESPRPGWAERDALSYWQALVECVQKLWQQGDVDPGRIAALALTTQRGTVVCAREDGTPLRPAIVWPDQRLCTRPPTLGALWNTLFGLAGAGGLIRQLQRQAEANWLAQHEAAMWQGCDRFTLLSGWLTHRLVGTWLDSAASQVGYLPFDYKRQQWARAGSWHWKALAIRPGQLPRLVPPARGSARSARPRRPRSACRRACRSSPPRPTRPARCWAAASSSPTSRTSRSAPRPPSTPRSRSTSRCSGCCRRIRPRGRAHSTPRSRSSAASGW